MTNRIGEVFGVPRVLLPVVHPVSREAALESVAAASAAGVRGIFLINQGMSTEEVLALVMTIRDRDPSLWVGVNLLGVPVAEVLARGLAACGGRLDGIWSDTAQIDEAAGAQPAAQAFVDARRQHGWNGLYFGGVAFKYQRAVSDDMLGAASAAALPFMDVVCTSGPGTGKEADPAKVIAMRRGMGERGALALASGVTEENVADYLPYVDAYLVGTGIEKDFGVLDPGKVARLHRLVAAFAPPP
jgi:predicted TIM-barrel enzyme